VRHPPPPCHVGRGHSVRSMLCCVRITHMSFDTGDPQGRGPLGIGYGRGAVRRLLVCPRSAFGARTHAGHKPNHNTQHTTAPPSPLMGLERVMSSRTLTCGHHQLLWWGVPRIQHAVQRIEVDPRAPAVAHNQPWSHIARWWLPAFSFPCSHGCGIEQEAVVVAHCTWPPSLWLWRTAHGRC